MPRIRTIKPQFPQSETIGRLSRDSRLLFIQLWTLVDDEGRTRAASRMLASLLYPFDEDAPNLINEWLNELEAGGCIRRYVADGNTYLDIPTFLKHQKIDHPSKSQLPEFREGSRELATNTRSLALYKDKDKEEDKDSRGRRTKGSRIAAEWSLDAEDAAFAQSKGLKRTQIVDEATKFKNHWISKSGKDATKMDWHATWQNWILNAIKWEAKSNGGSHGRPGTQQLSNLAFDLADEIQERELEEGIGREGDTLGRG